MIEVEAKSGQHYGTFKVFVNFIPVADITLLPKELFNAIKKDAIMISGILYAPPNLLRMGMYLELSRPAGDVSRWEKVMKRLTLLNKHYPLTATQCSHINFQRKMEDDKKTDEILNRQDKENFIRQIIKLRQDRADKNLKEATENAKKEASAIVPTTQANILEVPNPIVNLENLEKKEENKSGSEQSAGSDSSASSDSNVKRIIKIG